MFEFLKRKKQNDVSHEKKINTYDSMRNMAFSVTPEQLGVCLDNDEQVYGAIVEMGVGNGNVATMVCFIDGTASVYFSNGGGIIGAGQHESVRQVANSFLVSVHQVLSIMKQTKEFDVVPKENHHTFYLFTRIGVFTFDIDEEKYNESKETYLLFSLSQMVLSEIRKASDSR